MTARFGCQRSFNSLQTGKRIQSNLKPVEMIPVATGFNSLQTGKRIQRVQEVIQGEGLKDLFQFPSNGKAYPKKDSTQSAK